MDQEPNKQQNDLEGKIRKWLNNEGYPLELKTARAFQEAGFDVSLSSRYEDFETHQEREIDVDATRWSSLENNVALQVACRVECKKTKHPWVMFHSEAQPPTMFVQTNMIASMPFRTFVNRQFTLNQHREMLWKFPSFKPGVVGHSLVATSLKGNDTLRITDNKKGEEDSKHEINSNQHNPSYTNDGVKTPNNKKAREESKSEITTNQHNPAYAAAMTAVKASVDRIIQLDKFEPPDDTKLRYTCALIFPIIVLDGPLFQCYLDQNNEIVLKQTDMSILYWNHSNPLFTSPLVTVVTLPALKRFVEDTKNATDSLLKFTESHLDELEVHVKSSKKIF